MIVEFAQHAHEPGWRLCLNECGRQKGERAQPRGADSSKTTIAGVVWNGTPHASIDYIHHCDMDLVRGFVSTLRMGQTQSSCLGLVQLDASTLYLASESIDNRRHGRQKSIDATRTASRFDCRSILGLARLQSIQR